MLKCTITYCYFNGNWNSFRTVSFACTWMCVCWNIVAIVNVSKQILNTFFCIQIQFWAEYFVFRGVLFRFVFHVIFTWIIFMCLSVFIMLKRWLFFFSFSFNLCIILSMNRERERVFDVRSQTSKYNSTEKRKKKQRKLVWNRRRRHTHSVHSAQHNEKPNKPLFFLQNSF